jgi:hypothetical protein
MAGTQNIMLNRTTTGTDGWNEATLNGAYDYSFQAILNASSSGSATIVIEVSDDGVNALATPAETIILTLASGGTISDGKVCKSAWKYWRARLSAVSGTSATVNVLWLNSFV